MSGNILNFRSSTIGTLGLVSFSKASSGDIHQAAITVLCQVNGPFPDRTLRVSAALPLLNKEARTRDQADRKKVLFVSSMPASATNAIGTQILHFAEPFAPEWRHCYWDVGMGRSTAPGSHCLGSSVLKWWPFATGRGFLKREVEHFGLGWWRGDQLIQQKKPKLRRKLGGVGFALVAPLRNSEATRCREILETIGCPFVVHVWDISDERLNSDYEWLFSHAEHVFCLSETMIEEIHKAAPCETSSLPFVRARSQYQAKVIDGDTLIIGLIGFLSSYQEGLQILAQAIGGLRRLFANVRIRYIGSPGQLKFIPDSLKGIIEYMGFLDDDERDRVLSECHVGYLPGPLLPPQQDMRSRHSVPSRAADYMAIGLPVIAAANVLSATSIFFAPLRDRGFFLVRDGQDICLTAEKLRDRARWTEAAEQCSQFFDSRLNKEDALRKLYLIARPFL